MHRNATALALVLASLPLAAFAQRGAKAERAESIDYPEMRRDLETMRRILERQAFEVREASRSTQDEKPAAEGRAGRGGSGGGAASDGTGTNTTTGTNSANEDTLGSLLAFSYATTDAHGYYNLWNGNSEAFYVPGDGALFLMKTSTVLTPPPAESAEKDAPKESSLWEEVQSEVDGRARVNTRAYVRRGGTPYNGAAVEALKSRLLLALAKYGSKIGQLSDSQHLTIVMRGGAAGIASLSLAGRVTTASGGAELPDRNPLTIAAWPDGRHTFDGGAGTVLTIRVSRADVVAYADSLDLDTFKQRAKIAQY